MFSFAPEYGVESGHPPAQPRVSPSSDLVAFMHFVVDELQQEPHDVSQDEGGDEVPVNHVPQAADAPVEGPRQGSASVSWGESTWGQSSDGAGARGQWGSRVS